MVSTIAINLFDRVDRMQHDETTRLWADVTETLRGVVGLAAR